MADATEIANDVYESNPQIAELDKQLEVLDKQRLAIKDQARKLMRQKKELLIIENITLRVLTNTPLSGREQIWVTKNPEKWAKIKADTTGKRGSRKALNTKAGG